MIWSLCLPVLSLPPCSPLCQINQIWTWKYLPKGPETPSSDRLADSEHNLFFGGSFGGRCQSQNHPYCGLAQLSSICSGVFQPCWWAECFLAFISAANWAPWTRNCSTKQQRLACSQQPWLPPRNLISGKMTPQASLEFFFFGEISL